MSIDLHVIASRRIKYECPKTKQWLDDIQRYTIDTPDFRSGDNEKVAYAKTPYNVYRALVYEYWGSGEDLASHKLATDMIEYLDKQLKQAEDNGFTIEWEAW